MKESSEYDLIQQAMKVIGSRTSERKAAASRQNGMLGGRPVGSVKPLLTFSCSCGGQGIEHKSTCPRGRAIRYRLRKGFPLL